MSLKNNQTLLNHRSRSVTHTHISTMIFAYVCWNDAFGKHSPDSPVQTGKRGSATMENLRKIINIQARKPVLVEPEK